MDKFNRVVYDAVNQSLYLTDHYYGFIRLNNVSDGVVGHFEGVAAENVSYLLANDPGGSAHARILALKNESIAQENNNE